MLKKVCFEMRTVTKLNPERDFLSLMSKQRKYLPLFGFSVTMPLARQVPYVTKEQIYVDAISR